MVAADLMLVSELAFLRACVALAEAQCSQQKMKKQSRHGEGTRGLVPKASPPLTKSRCPHPPSEKIGRPGRPHVQSDLSVCRVSRGARRPREAGAAGLGMAAVSA